MCCADSVDVNVERTTATEPTPAPECKVEDGVVLKDREWHCPAPNVTIYCNAGVKETTNHCPSLDCVNVIRGPNMCDCPMCICTFTESHLPYVHIPISFTSHIGLFHAFNFKLLYYCR